MSQHIHPHDDQHDDHEHADARHNHPHPHEHGHDHAHDHHAAAHDPALADAHSVTNELPSIEVVDHRADLTSLVQMRLNS